MRLALGCLALAALVSHDSAHASPTMMSIIGQVGQRASTTDCTGSPTPGTVCAGGAIYLGTLSSTKYMVSAGGCGYETSGSSTTTPNATFTPTCSGTDAVQKKWSTNVEAPVSYSVSTGATSTTNGEANTTTLAVNYGDTAAARYCYFLSANGYTDWFLPAYDELNLLYTNRASIAGVVSGAYWSSSENTATAAWPQDFPNSGSHDSNASKTNTRYVRCVRKF